jgi:hypothetical protein
MENLQDKVFKEPFPISKVLKDFKDFKDFKVKEVLKVFKVFKDLFPTSKELKVVLEKVHIGQ